VEVPPQAAFVLAVRQKLGLTKTKLGKALGQDNAYSRGHAWESETTQLHYAEMMRMLLMCDWLTKDALKALQKATLGEAARVVNQAVDEAPKPTPRQIPDSPKRRASRR